MDQYNLKTVHRRKKYFLSKQRLAWKAYPSTCYMHFLCFLSVFIFPGVNIHLALFRITDCSVGSVHVSLLFCVDTIGQL